MDAGTSSGAKLSDANVARLGGGAMPFDDFSFDLPLDDMEDVDPSEEVFNY